MGIKLLNKCSISMGSYLIDQTVFCENIETFVIQFLLYTLKIVEVHILYAKFL